MIPPNHTIGVLGFAEAGDEVLLVRTGYGARRWQLPGGFVESGESLPAALRREFREELGVDVSVGSLVGLYLRLWDDNLVLVFRVSGNFSHLHPDPAEILDVSWFPHDALPPTSSPRTRRIVRDALEAPAPGVVTFRSPTDPGASDGSDEASSEPAREAGLSGTRSDGGGSR